MLKTRIKTISIACVLVLTLPIISHSLDKEEFLKFLINSSYPESKTESDDVNGASAEIDSNGKENENNTSENSEQDYIKFHVGKENVPEINSSTNEKNIEPVSTSNLQYENDITITKKNPSILIYHTHSGETYANAPAGNYHSTDKANSVMAIGELLTAELDEKGWGVLHTTKYHDYPEFNGAYTRSLKTIKELIQNNKSIDIAIDLHRDGRDFKNEAAKKADHDRMSATVNGESVAKFFFVVGPDNPNKEEVMALAEDITNFAKKKYPQLIAPIVVKDFGKFNQYVAKKHMLIEIGSNGTSIEEAKASVKYVAEILDEYFKQTK